MYRILFSQGVEQDLVKTRAYDRSIILEAVEKQLVHNPHVETKNRKMLVNLMPSFEGQLPIWELRVGEHRVFYDVDEEGQQVFVRAIRRKPPHRTTEEIL